MNHDVVNRRVALEVGERAGRTDQPRAIHRKAHDVTLLEGPSDLVSLPPTEIRELEELDQRRPLDAIAPTLHCNRIGMRHMRPPARHGSIVLSSHNDTAPHTWPDIRQRHW